MTKPAVAVKQDETPTEVLAASIVAISKAVHEMRNGRLNERALLLLISNASGVPQYKVAAVLNGMEQLEREFVRPARKT